MFKTFPDKEKNENIGEYVPKSDARRGMEREREAGQMFCLPETPQGASTSLPLNTNQCVQETARGRPISLMFNSAVAVLANPPQTGFIIIKNEHRRKLHVLCAWEKIESFSTQTQKDD